MTPLTRSRRAILVAVAVGLGLAGCGHPAPSPSSPPETGSAAVALTPATPSTSDHPTADDASIPRLGDAATNPACALAAPSEISQAVGGLPLRDILGVSGPGSYSPALWSCTWHFQDTDISAPAVAVLFERTPTVHSEVIAYDKSLIAQHYGTGVAGLGDVAVLHPYYVDVVSRKILLKVRVQLHNDSGGPESDQILAVTRLVLARITP